MNVEMARHQRPSLRVVTHRKKQPKISQGIATGIAKRRQWMRGRDREHVGCVLGSVSCVSRLAAGDVLPYAKTWAELRASNQEATVKAIKAYDGSVSMAKQGLDCSLSSYGCLKYCSRSGKPGAYIMRVVGCSRSLCDRITAVQ